MNRVELKERAKVLLYGKRGPLAVVTLITTIIAGMSQVPERYYFSSISTITLVLISLLTSIIGFGVTRIYLDVTNGEEVNIERLFYGFRLSVFFKIIGIQIIIYISVFAASLLLFVPGIIVGLMFSQSLLILCEDNSKGVVECISESTRLMKGFKIDLFVLELSFIGWLLVISLTCGIAALWVVPYIGVVNTLFYLELKKIKSGEKIKQEINLDDIISE